MSATATGYAVVKDGKIDIRTIGDSRIAVMVNHLFVKKDFFALAVTTDAEITAEWLLRADTDAEIRQVIIALLDS